MKKRLPFLILIMLLLVNTVSAGEKRRKVYAIAYIASAYYELEDLAKKNDWFITNPERADTVVAAVRSRRINPLKNTYGDHMELEEDVKNNTEKEGNLHIVYFYDVEKNGSLTVEKSLFSRVEED